MHWHEDIQFIYVLDGEIEVVTLEYRTTLHKGDGFFINKNVVHLVDTDHGIRICYRINSFCSIFIPTVPSVTIPNTK